MYPARTLLRDNLTEAHARSWANIGQPGDFLTARQRIEIVRLGREALDCHFCEDRKAALSPHAVTGQHHCTSTTFEAEVVDFIHRLRTDPGRITKQTFLDVTQHLTIEAYVELVAVLNTSVIIDTLHNALGLGRPALPLASKGTPSGEVNSDVIDAGAWVPILKVPEEPPTPTADQTNNTSGTPSSDSKQASRRASPNLPEVPNIARALGLVPNALALFFGTFRPHYALKDIQLSISQAQAEFVAARVSAINECFY